MILVCTECSEGHKACTLMTDDARTQVPVYCSPDEQGRIRVPVWHEAPISAELILKS